MGELESAVEDGWLSENDILPVELVVLIDVLRAVEPYEVADAVSVRDVGADPFPALSRLCLLEADDPAFYLYEGHIRRKL